MNDLDGYEIRSKKEIELTAWMMSKRLMSRDEKIMSREQFGQLAEAAMTNNMYAALVNGTGARMETTRSISLGELGVHNFDYELRIASRVDAIVKMHEKNDKNKKGIRLKTVCALDRNNNTVYTVPAEEKLVLDKKSQYTIVGVTTDGKLVIPEQKTFKGSEINDDEFISAEIVESKEDTYTTLKKIMNLR